VMVEQREEGCQRFGDKSSPVGVGVEVAEGKCQGKKMGWRKVSLRDLY
jgi:hypothetical protein